MARSPNTDELTALLGALTQVSALEELAFLVACFVLARGVVRLLRGKVAPEGSIWFGRRIVDGVLFPVLALAFAYGAKLATAGSLQLSGSSGRHS